MTKLSVSTFHCGHRKFSHGIARYKIYVHFMYDKNLIFARVILLYAVDSHHQCQSIYKVDHSHHHCNQ